MDDGFVYWEGLLGAMSCEHNVEAFHWQLKNQPCYLENNFIFLMQDCVIISFLKMLTDKLAIYWQFATLLP